MDVEITIKSEYSDVISYKGHDIKMAEALVALAKLNPQPTKGEQ